MKKIYQSPELDVVAIEEETVIAASPLTEGESGNTPNEDEVDVPLDVQSKRRAFEFDDEDLF